MKKTDLVIFGATGFTGRFVVETLVKTISKYGLSTTWAIASRNSERMRECLNDVSAITGTNLSHIPIFEANVKDVSSMNHAFKQTKLVLNCIGPYSLLGEPVVNSCINSGAHYMDLSGEPLYLEKMQFKYNDLAHKQKISIIGSCGFDSIPADLGTLFLKKKFDGSLNQVEHYLQMWSKEKNFNYATWQSLIEGYKCRDQLKILRKEAFSKLYKPYDWIVPLNRNRFVKRQFGYCVPFPGADRSVVLRSQLFRYTHRNEKPIQFEAYFCLPQLRMVMKLVLVNINLQFFTKFKFGQNLLANYSQYFSFGMFSQFKKPSRENLELNKFRITLVGKGWSKGENDFRVDNMSKCSAVVINGGDVGYIDTSTIAVQYALVILDKIKQNNLPSGVLTPGSVIEPDELIPRLCKEGIQFEFISDFKTS